MREIYIIVHTSVPTYLYFIFDYIVISRLGRALFENGCRGEYNMTVPGVECGGVRSKHVNIRKGVSIIIVCCQKQKKNFNKF